MLLSMIEASPSTRSELAVLTKVLNAQSDSLRHILAITSYVSNPETRLGPRTQSPVSNKGGLYRPLRAVVGIQRAQHFTYLHTLVEITHTNLANALTCIFSAGFLASLDGMSARVIMCIAHAKA
jgi:hypothetical protein